MIPLLVLSLTRSQDRRAYMTEQLAKLNIPFKFFDGIEGRNMSPAEIAALSPRPYAAQMGRELTPSEIGVAASFRAILESILKGNEPYVAVCEDDVEFFETVKPFLERAALDALPRFDIVKLYRDRKLTYKASPSLLLGQVGDHHVYAALRGNLGCVAQVFSKDGAKKILDQMVPLTAPLDNLIYRDACIIGLRVIQLAPSVATYHELPSTIGDKVWQNKTLPRNLKRKLALLMRNVRSVYSFARAWGVPALFRLRPPPL